MCRTCRPVGAARPERAGLPQHRQRAGAAAAGPVRADGSDGAQPAQLRRTPRRRPGGTALTRVKFAVGPCPQAARIRCCKSAKNKCCNMLATLRQVVATFHAAMHPAVCQRAWLPGRMRKLSVCVCVCVCFAGFGKAAAAGLPGPVGLQPLDRRRARAHRHRHQPADAQASALPQVQPGGIRASQTCATFPPATLFHRLAHTAGRYVVFLDQYHLISSRVGTHAAWARRTWRSCAPCRTWPASASAAAHRSQPPAYPRSPRSPLSGACFSRGNHW